MIHIESNENTHKTYQLKFQVFWAWLASGVFPASVQFNSIADRYQPDKTPVMLLTVLYRLK